MKNSEKADRVRTAVANITRFYAEERKLSHLPRDAAFRLKPEKAVRPLLHDLYAWLQKKAPQTPLRNTIGEAVNYTLEELQKIERYLDNEHLTPDTNRVGNVVRPL